MLIATLLAAAGSPAQAPEAGGWITHPAATAAARPIVLHFRRSVSLARVPRSYLVDVTADNRFTLYVNGSRVGTGPATGDIAHWRVSRYDLAPFLKPGRNVVAAVVWNYVVARPVVPAGASEADRKAAEGRAVVQQVAPSFQQSVATGFRLTGQGAADAISTKYPGWRAEADAGHSARNGFLQIRRDWYVASAPETIDAAKASWQWTGPAEPGSNWVDAVPSPKAAQRTLVADRLPAMSYHAVPSGRVVRSDLPGGAAFPGKPVTIPPNSKATLLLQRDAMVSAYPELDVSGGKGARIKLTYAEALYDAKMLKGDRSDVGNRKIVGIFDSFVADGEPRSFAPLWWRTWRYLQIDVETADTPVELQALRTFETGYPFVAKGYFRSDDSELNRIWQIGWRTALVDAHETYMDPSYWEQLQYVGDTRLQALISYAVAGDPRLAEQAIDAFGASRTPEGLTESAYPSRTSNIIPPFSLLWIGMMHDWWMAEPDTAPIARNLKRMREVLDWYHGYLRPDGLIGKTPYWNFVDWAGQPATDRTLFPAYGKDGASCLLSLLYLGSLDQAADLEGATGTARIAAENRALAHKVRSAIAARCWVAERKLFSDTPDGDVFSQHSNALAVLYDVVPPAERAALLERIVVPGKGIDAPKGLFQASYYFAWYLVQAFDHAGLADDYPALLESWRALLPLNFTTWPEERGKTRSDSHAWSAHPTADLLGLVAGIRPDAPGYARLVVAPHLGALRDVDAAAATPQGPVRVRYRVAGGRLTATIERPSTLPGRFHWQGRDYPLTTIRTRLVLDAPIPLRDKATPGGRSSDTHN